MTHSIRRSLVRFVVLPLLLMVAVVVVPSPRVSVAAPARSGPSSTSLSSLLPSPSNVRAAYGAGFKMVLSTAISNQQAILTFGAVGTGPTGVTLSGRVTGYDLAYQRGYRGLYNVVSTVNVYKATGDAQRAVANALRNPKSLPGLKLGVAATSGVGSKALLVTKHVASIYSLLVGFQRGRYTAAVEVGSIGSKPAMSTVLGLAKVIDSRIQSHG
jgi:hypothetical protein